MKEITVTDEMLDFLRERVRGYLKEKRYLHTLGVEREAKSLGEMFLPSEKINNVRAAALLHDITKKLTPDEHIEILTEFGIPVTDADKASPKLFHSKTASLLIGRDFPEYADDEIVSAVRLHTTGKAGMSVFEAIVYLADYIEDTRTFDDCVALREYFYKNLDSISKEELPDHFAKTMVKSFDMTMANLISESAPIDRDTVEARNYYLSLLRK